MAKLERLRKHFGTRKVPRLLEALIKLSDKYPDDFLSGNFELNDCEGKDAAHELAAHLPGAVEAVGDELRSGLALFAQEPDGSSYALWFHSGQAPDAAPVVYLDSEGSDDALVATNLEEFLALLRLDLDDVGRFYSVKRDAAREPAARIAEYRKWADKQGIAPAPRSPKTLVKRARAAQPDFAKWMGALRERMWAADPALRKAKSAPNKAKKAKLEPERDAYGVVALEIDSNPKKLEPCLAQAARAISARAAGVEPTTQLALGLTTTRAIDFHQTGKLPADLAEASELRTVWSAGKRKRVLIVEPPEKSSKLWTVSFYSWPHPADDAQARADLADFDAAMARAGKLKLRRGNAAKLA